MRGRTLRMFVKALAIAAAASCAGCGSSPSAPTGAIVLTLGPGQSGLAAGLSLTFVRVTSDTRCPADAFCIQAGDARVEVETGILGAKQTVELYLVDPARRSTTHGRYTVTLEELNPYPLLSRGPIAHGDYRARFRVTQP